METWPLCGQGVKEAIAASATSVNKIDYIVAVCCTYAMIDGLAGAGLYLRLVHSRVVTARLLPCFTRLCWNQIRSLRAEQKSNDHNYA